MARSLLDGLPPAELWPDRVYSLPQLGYPAHLNVARELLDVHAQGDRAKRPAIFFGEDVVTYGELHDRVNRLANGLREFGVAPGDRVLLRLPNVPEFVIVWLALQKLGAVAVSTMPLLRARELAAIAADSDAEVAVVWSSLRGELDRARMLAPVLKRVITAGDSSQPGEVSLASLMDGRSTRFPTAETRATDVAMIAYTSGSTGVPKGCVHQHSDILASADSYARHVLDPSEDDRFGGHPTLAFTFGTGGLLVFPLRFGAATVLCGPFEPERMLETVERYRVTQLFCAPTSYKLMLGVTTRRYDVSSLRHCVSAAEPLQAATYERWLQHTGKEILDGIGSTEMFHIFISARKGRVRPGSTGFAVPGYECRIVDEAGKDVPRGTRGFMAVRGPTGCKYWRRPEKQAEYVRFGGWNVTGDVYVQDEAGYFTYQCRSDDMIVCGGYKIAGIEVEHVLEGHPAVAECAVIAAPDAHRGAVPKALVVVRAGFEASDALAKELQERVKCELAPYKYPRSVEFVPTLPRTENGKIRRVELRERERK